MSLKTCLILAAGFGSRMGEIGKKLPKVIWPIFEKSLLELQVLQLRELGFQKIYINLHHQRKLILNIVKDNKNFDGVEFLIEEEILDIGGGIHNLGKKIGYKESVYIVNSDQFFFIEKKHLREYDSRTVIFLIKDNSSNLYNEVEVDSLGHMKKINQNFTLPRNQMIYTYSGNSIVDFSLLRPTEGKTNFFDTVANFKESKIATIKLDQVEYWDFGTKKLYWENMFKLLNDSESTMAKFLRRMNSIDSSKLKVNSYFSSIEGVINLGSKKITRGGSPSIIIGEAEIDPTARSIIYEDIVDLIY